MTNCPESNLWNIFNFGEDSPDPGGGILYAIRYDTDSLCTHRDAVIARLTASGATIFLTEEGLLAIDISDLDDESEDTALLLIEELSVVNGALEYHENGINPDSIEGLANYLKSTFYWQIASEYTDIKISALNLVDLIIPQVVEDLQTAHAQSGVLSLNEQQTVKELGQFASSNSDLFGNLRVVDLSTYSLN